MLTPDDQPPKVVSLDDFPRVMEEARARAIAAMKPRLAPWFYSCYGRPIWLTPSDRAFLAELQIQVD